MYKEFKGWKEVGKMRKIGVYRTYISGEYRGGISCREDCDIVLFGDCIYPVLDPNLDPTVKQKK